MRILLVNANRSVVGGTESYLRTLLPALAQKGHCLALLHEYAVPEGSQAIDDDCGPVPRWCVAEHGSSFCLQQAALWGPDLVYFHGVVDVAIEEQLSTTYKAVLYAHNYHGTCATGTKCHSWPSPRPCNRQLGPACLVLNYTRRCGTLHPLRLWNAYRDQSKRQHLLSRYRAVLVASKHMEAEFRQHAVDPSRLYRVPLPLPGGPPTADLPEWSGWTNKVLLVGRLTRLKGGNLLIPAMVQASQALGRRLTLVVAGTGPEQATWQSLARQWGLDCDFAGWADRAQLTDMYRRIDLVAVPSLWPEPFGLIGIEGGCWGVPAVGFATGGIPDWLVPGESGESAPGQRPTVEGLAAAIVRALKDPGHYQRLRAGAWQMAQRYTLDRHLQLLEPILNGAIRD